MSNMKQVILLQDHKGLKKGMTVIMDDDEAVEFCKNYFGKIEKDYHYSNKMVKNTYNKK